MDDEREQDLDFLLDAHSKVGKPAVKRQFENWKIVRYHEFVDVVMVGLVPIHIRGGGSASVTPLLVVRCSWTASFSPAVEFTK
eukprot:scaffold10501_cov141-Amphora_coffeaeformis.AAC.13